ncbi:MAG TPA: hypothetical protein EYP14_14010 [Planctomycetaceae bacterium]|nr:hypothetical protein [Planctomycetaceae bacterium]
MEGLGDLPGLYCIPMSSGVYRGGRNVYRYTFPERIMLHGPTNFGSGDTVTDRFLETFLEGMRFDIVGRPKAASVNLLALRRQFTPWIYEAQFRDIVGLRVGDPRVKARVFTKPNVGILINLLNRARLTRVEVRVRGRGLSLAPSAFFVGLSGAAGALEAKREGDEIVFQAPDELASTVVIPQQSPKTAPIWPVFYLRRYAQPAVLITLFNLTDVSRTGTCSIENLGFTEPFQTRRADTRAALPLAQTTLSFSVGPREARVVAFAIRSLREHRWTVRLRAVVSLKGGVEIARTFLATPLALDSSWEVWGTPEPNAPHGKCTLTLPPTSSGYQHQLFDLWLEPEHRYRLRVKAKRTGFKAKVAGTLLMVNDPKGHVVWARRGLDRRRPNQWQTISYDFETPSELERAGIYLYNVRSSDIAGFDDLQVRDLGRTR